MAFSCAIRYFYPPPMKPRFCFFIAAVLCSVQLNAQRTSSQLYRHCGLPAATVAILERQLIVPAALAKSTTATERMIASTDFIRSSNFPVVNDSTAYFYHGQRGNVFNEAGFPVQDGMEDAAVFATSQSYSEMIDFAESYTSYDSAVEFGDGRVRAQMFRKLFDSRGNVTSLRVSKLEAASGSATDIRLHTFTYNAIDKVRNILVEAVNPGTGSVTPLNNCSITFSANLRATDSLHNTALNIPLRKQIYTYDGGRMIRCVYFDWGSASWDTTNTFSYSYDTLGRIVASRYETWDSAGNGSVSVDTLYYQGVWRTPVSIVSKSIMMFGTRDASRTTFWLNSKGKPERTQYYLPTSMGWTPVSESRIRFNSNDHVISHSTRTIGGTWTDSLHVGYYYAAQPTGVQKSARRLELSVYPNPASGTVTLTIPGFQGSGNVEVRDGLGRKVLEAGVSGETCRLPLSDLSKGAYFLTVNANGERMGKSLVVQ